MNASDFEKLCLALWASSFPVGPFQNAMEAIGMTATIDLGNILFPGAIEANAAFVTTNFSDHLHDRLRGRGL